MFDSARSLGAEAVEPQAIHFEIHFGDQPSPKFDPLGWGDLAFEYRVLYSLSVVKTGAGNPPKAAAAGRCLRADIIGDKHEHGGLSLPEEGGITIQVAAQISRQKLGLEGGEKPEGGCFAEEGMAQGVALAFLPSHEHALPRLVA